jgi:hypothetical protein
MTKPSCAADEEEGEQMEWVAWLEVEVSQGERGRVLRHGTELAIDWGGRAHKAPVSLKGGTVKPSNEALEVYQRRPEGRSVCSLAPRRGTMDADRQKLVRRLEQYDMSFVFERLTSRGHCTSSEVPVLEREFKRFVALVGFGIRPLAMIGPVVDEVWHQFILFTRQYREFCHATVGFFIGHQPDTASAPIPVTAGENFRCGFKQFFGNLPKIWFKGMNEATISYYLQPTLAGKPPMEWSGWVGEEECLDSEFKRAERVASLV